MTRTVPGILLAAVWVALLLLGSPLLFFWAIVGVAGVGAYEYVKMTFRGALSAAHKVYLITALIFPVFFAGNLVAALLPADGLFVSFFLLSLYIIYRYTHLENSYELLARMMFGAVYVGLLISYLVFIRELEDGGRWLVVLSAVTAGSDTGAYLFGSAFGSRKLCPSISPKKTVEGALGGLLCGVAAAVIMAMVLFDDLNLLLVAVMATVLTGVGILGDLTESIIKRGTGTKDSGRILAGHGGALDRIDSLLMSAPVFYYMLMFIGLA